MAYNSIFIAAFIFLATASIAHGYVVNGVPIAEVRIPGRLLCAAGGNPAPGARGLAGTNVLVSCDGGNTSLSQVLTNTNGFFEVLLGLIDGVAFDPSFCAIYVKLPVVECAVLPPTGFLRAAVNVTSVIPTALGFIATLLPELFSVVA